MQAFAKQLFDEVHPMWLLRILPNNVLAYTGITYGFKGPNHNVTNHAVGGTQALLEAYHAIRSGQAERAVVVAYDVGTEPQALLYYEKLGVLSKQHLIPFDKAHDGTLLAEGAAALVLESENSVRARGANCYAEIVGGFSASEGAGLFSLDQTGKPLTKLIQKTLNGLAIKEENIDMIVAHGNANIASDNSEAASIEQIPGLSQTPVTAFKWATGHTLCASGVLDAVLMSYSLKNRCIPGIAPLSERAPECQGLNVQAETRALPSRGGSPNHALMISRGFASMNAYLVMASCD
jgi:3-oxoacyl-[acyl-carrier-protein] synthase-1